MAKKERERRKKNSVEGKVVKEFTEEEVFGPDDEGETTETEPPDGGPAEPTDEGGDGQAESGDAAPPPSPSDDWERDSRERHRSETEWRTRFQNARKRVEAAREYRQALEGLHLSAGGRYVDENGRTVIRSLDHLKQLVREADDEQRAAEQALVDIREEARRAGVPPGWLR